MDDFALLRDMADRTPLPSAADLAPARARLSAALANPSAALAGPTDTPANPTAALASSADTPANPTAALGHPTAALTGSTDPLANPTTAFAHPTAAPAGSTDPLANPTTAPVNPTAALAGSTAAPLIPAQPNHHPTNGHSLRPSLKDEQLTTRIEHAEPQHDQVTSLAGKPRRRRRLVVSAAAVVGLAAAITGVVALGGLESVGVAPPKASAADILHQAADAAREQPATPPRPDQFVYTKSQNPDGSVREAWLSADGTRDGLVRQMGEDIPLAGCRDGQAPVIKGSEAIPGMFEPCEPSPAYLADIPTTAAEMRTYIEQLGGDPKSPNSVGKNILFVAGENYVSPESLAALFEALATFPGLTVDEHATDGAGRPGTGVSWTVDGRNPQGEPAPVTTALVFDPATHVFLGLSSGTAVVERGIVDAAGQRP